MLALLDLPFINPTGGLVIEHLDTSCDTEQKRLRGLDAPALDRIHRFLRLWRKLEGWAMWELDLAVRHVRVGGGSLDRPFLVSLFHLCRLRERLGPKTTVEQLCGLFGDLNTETRFTKPHAQREGGLYQALFLNERLIHPLDPAFEPDATGELPAGQTLGGHRPAVVAALGLREADLVRLQGLTKASSPTESYITDDLTLGNLSFLWRHAWLSRALGYGVEEWVDVLKVLNRDLPDLTDPATALALLEGLDHLEVAGFTADELTWLLAADGSADAAPSDADAVRFLTGLRKDTAAIRDEFDPSRYPVLGATPPTDLDGLAGLLTALLQRLGRDETGADFCFAVLAGDAVSRVPVSGLPAGFAFPDAITGDPNRIPIRYREAAGELQFVGLMTEDQRTLLLTDPSLAGVSAMAAYRDAVEALFQRPRLAVKFFEPRFAAPLRRLPVEIDFPSQLPAASARRVSYDGEQRLLHFEGIMTPDERAALDALADQADYRAAVATLAAEPVSLGASDERVWLTEDDLDASRADLDTVPKRLANAARKALAYLSRTLSGNAVVQAASTELGLSPAAARRLMTRYPVLPGAQALLERLRDDFAVDAETIGAWRWAVRTAAIWGRWRLSPAELELLSGLPDEAQALDFATLPLDEGGGVASLDRLLATDRLLRLRDRLPETGVSLLDVLDTLASGGYPDASEFARDVARLDGAWDRTDVEVLVASLDLAYPEAFLRVATWERLGRAFRFMERLNAGAERVTAFAVAAMTRDHVAVLNELLRARFGADTWLTLSQEIQDGLRERKRDALTAYLLTRPTPEDAPTGKWESTNDLYAYHLLDVEMSACQLTSRLVQGSGSVQLFVQRCLMGLEPHVQVKADGDDGDDAWRWWSWMRKYRVWEANRKVFLWPENWIEPELNKDRSPFFKDLENALLQDEVTPHSVEAAFSGYLERLDGVAHLEIAGFYQEDRGESALVHVFGRTGGAEPHLYYYRRYDYRQWTPWEKVDLDIQGDYLIPAVANGRLFLFWPVFTETPDEEGNKTSRVPSGGETSFEQEPVRKRQRLQLALSEYREGKWTPRRLSQAYDESASFTGERANRGFHFLPVDRSGVDDRFGIQYQGQGLAGMFELGGCHGDLEQKDYKHNLLPQIALAVRPETAATLDDTLFQKWLERSGRTDKEDDLSLEDLTGSGRLKRILEWTPGLFRVTPPWQLSYFDRLWQDGLAAYGVEERFGRTGTVGTWLPFFYGDRRRSFFVLPSPPVLPRPVPEEEQSEDSEHEEGSRAYYPELKARFREWEGFFEGQLRSWAEDFDLDDLGDAERQDIERFLRGELRIEATPPYSDERLRELAVRFLMRYVHLFLGLWAFYLFPSRQLHFKNFYHPLVCDFAKLVSDPLKGIPVLMSRETQLRDTGFRFLSCYGPNDSVVEPGTEAYYPTETVDFTPDGAYSPYNWELFFHAPLLIANALSRNQRFAEARDWYHFIFNPLGVDGPGPGGSAMSRYWITKPFFETTDPQYLQQRIDSILRMLAGGTGAEGYSEPARRELERQVRDWRTHPFEPHRIAGYRTVAYQKAVVMKYLDNLIAWGDYLFRQDSMESINEATQLYVLAAEILGPRPRKVPARARPPERSFHELEHDLDVFSNALMELENRVPVLPGPGADGTDPAPLPMLYFCIPPNENLLAYWDRVADRLYKIRHCMNIEGVVRQLSLFEPPIEPGALVKALAGGADIGSVLADLSAPLPLYRFNVLLQKANEVCGDVKALGGALLAALEKKDAEAMALLRQGQELSVLEAVRAVREQQIEEAKTNLEGLKQSRTVVEVRRDYYRDIEKIIPGEQSALDLQDRAQRHQTKAQRINIAASVLGYLPNVTIGASGFGGSPHVNVQWGTGNIISALQAASGSETLSASVSSHEASKASVLAGYERRFSDWKLQEALAENELAQIDQQIAAAELRLAIAEKELENHDLQIENAKATDALMRSKYTNQELYQWQVGQISGVYFQSYQLAYDLAKRAERCLRFELGLRDSSYIRFGYWDSLKKGLLSGERLQYDLRRLETAFLDQNRREFELTKHVSLALLDPLALVQLRETGRCFFELPEEIFDLDYPGHYFRRVKSVSLTLPCVVGPYTTVSCTLRLLRNAIRVSTADGDAGYPRNRDEAGLPADDGRFVEHSIPVKAMAVSGAQNDSGVFELSFRDERYLPFEGAGAISGWSLELFNDPPSHHPDFGRPLRQFDYGTLSDAVLHVRYTAREDAGPFKNAAIEHLRDHYGRDGATPLLRLLNLGQEFPTEWHRFLDPQDPTAGNVLDLPMGPTLFPVRDRGKTLKVHRIWLIARCAGNGDYTVEMSPPFPAPPEPPEEDPNRLVLTPVEGFGGLHLSEKPVDPSIAIVPTEPPENWRLTMTRPGGGSLLADEIQDMWLVLGYEYDYE